MTDVHVERVSLRLRGVPVDTGRAVAGGLAAELTRQLATAPAPHRPLPRGASAAQLRTAAASELARRIREEAS